MRRLAIRASYLTTEAVLLASQLCWTVLFAKDGMMSAALGAAWLVACIGGVRLAPSLAAAFRQRAVVHTGG